MSVDETPAIIIDNGCDTLKVGFTGDDEPTGIFRNVVLLSEGADGSMIRTVGCVAGKPYDRFKRPMQRSEPYDWDAMECVWEHAFKDVLKVAPENHRVLFTDRPLSPDITREKSVQIMFEKFSTPATYVSMQSTLALYGSGRTTGTVLNVGDFTSSVVPIYKGTPVREAIRLTELAGCDMIEYLSRALYIRDQEMAREIMEKVCAVSADAKKETVKYIDYKTSDGAVHTIGEERYRCGDVLFNPSLISPHKVKPLQQQVVESVAICEEIIRKTLYAYIVLAGGPTTLNGFAERMQKEVTALLPSKYKCKVVTTQHPVLNVWAGGCMVAQSPLFQQSWITKQEYEEHGANIIHQKCV
ncbi:actin-3-like [Anopheles marshallii]|uniref:actin-3-like n=1 Tax=Anopheles marshallii TaxID=1521116 RepID=UPI00237BC80D|nr:actin-3-like [Anopheles marshallii]